MYLKLFKYDNIKYLRYNLTETPRDSKLLMKQNGTACRGQGVKLVIIFLLTFLYEYVVVDGGVYKLIIIMYYVVIRVQ